MALDRVRLESEVRGTNGCIAAYFVKIQTYLNIASSGAENLQQHRCHSHILQDIFVTFNICMLYNMLSCL